MGYYEWVKNNSRQLPLDRRLRLTGISITGLMYLGRGDGSDFWVEVDQGRLHIIHVAMARCFDGQCCGAIDVM